MNKKGVAPIVVLLVIAGVLLVGGVWYYETHKAINTVPAQSQSASTSAVPPCSDFGQFSSFVLANAFDPTLNIRSFPTLPSAFQNGSIPFGAFRWKRENAEPFMSYPIIESTVTSTYDYELDNKTIQAETSFASSNLAAKLPQEIAALGFTANNLNTLPLSSDEGGLAGTQIFGFTKGDDLYSVVLSEEQDYQAPGGVTITAACARQNSAYDKLYDALNLQVSTSTQDPYDDDYIEVATTSPDSTVYELLGSPNRISIADYYYFNGSTPLLVSTDSSPVDCNILENEKIGEGMTCWLGNYPMSTVAYSTSSGSGNVGWQIYSNPQLGISFAYPPDGSVKVGRFSLPYATVPPFVPYPTITVSLPFLTNPHPEDWTGKSLLIAFHYNDSCSNWGLGQYSTSTQKTVNNTTYSFQDPSVADTSGMSVISKQRIYYMQSVEGCVVITEQLTGYGTNEGPAPTTIFSPDQENAFIATEMATLDDMVSTLQLEWGK